MIRWFGLLLVLSLIQSRLYLLSVSKLVRLSVPYFAALALGLFAAEALQNFFLAINLDWWLGVVSAFGAFLIGEIFSLSFREEEKMIKRKGQKVPSFFAFSVLFVALAWASEIQPSFLRSIQTRIAFISMASLILTIVLTGVRDRLVLSDVPKNLQGLPIILISAALLLLSLYGLAEFANS